MKPLAALSVDQFDRTRLSLLEHADALAGATPATGWIHAIRQLLQMSSTALAKRLGIAHSGLLKIEKGERLGTVSLATLKRAAAALDADFVYAIVPRRPVRDTITARALQLARERVLPVTKSMQLEDQSLTDEQIERRIDELARELESRPRHLWR